MIETQWSRVTHQDRCVLPQSPAQGCRRTPPRGCLSQAPNERNSRPTVCSHTLEIPVASFVKRLSQVSPLGRAARDERRMRGTRLAQNRKGYCETLDPRRQETMAGWIDRWRAATVAIGSIQDADIRSRTGRVSTRKFFAVVGTGVPVSYTHLTLPTSDLV